VSEAMLPSSITPVGSCYWPCSQRLPSLLKTAWAASQATGLPLKLLSGGLANDPLDPTGCFLPPGREMTCLEHMQGG
jgi:hypothetical protein